ncbi:MAG TPA: peptide ABC transporter substrate-binding protein [Lachnospiraceae bacterium]|nr:peptide ABC transporter substrate-binding protein [Lachnospiraceae bacterium]
MKRHVGIAMALLLGVSGISGCSKPSAGTADSVPSSAASSQQKINTSQFLTFVGNDGDSMDPQCTSGLYTVALNVFDRLVEVQVNNDGSSSITPSLARSWEISPDGLSYTFTLQEHVKFSNGSDLTSSDVRYTLTRLLTHPDAVNKDIAMAILGADALRSNEADTLEGFREIDDTQFVITLKEPYAAFLANLSSPGASILDEETTEKAGERFGRESEVTIGTGPFVFKEWNKGYDLVMTANPDCWSGAPRCKGLKMLFVEDPEAQRLMFERGELDILDLEGLSTDAEYFVNGDIYQPYLHQGPRVGISYIALNESIEPLDDVRVRTALQQSLDRQLLLEAVYSGRGTLENGILPHGLIGYNPNLPAIPYDPDGAKKLLKEAGWDDGFTMNISVEKSDYTGYSELLTLVSAMWEKIGVKTEISVVEDEAFYESRKKGALSCYTSTWSADFNDPDNFMYTFFGTPENTFGRSLCYGDTSVMDRVSHARSIVNEAERIKEYQELEEIIVQKDAAWIPLYSRDHYFVVSKRVEGFKVSWNGWSSNRYSDVAVLET